MAYQDAFEYVTVNTGTVLTESKDGFEYVTTNTIFAPTGFTCEKVPAPGTANSAYWEDNGNATLATTGATLVTPGGYGQTGNIVTKSTYQMGSFEFNLTMSAATGADGFTAGILYASQESSTSLGGAGGALGFYGPNLAGVAFLCSNYNNNLTLSRCLTHGGSASTTTVSGVGFSGVATYKIIAIYTGGTSYNFSMLRDGSEIFSPVSVSLPSVNESVRFFVAGTTGGANGTWTLGSASILESCGYRRGYGISRY